MKAFYVCDPDNECAEIIFSDKRSQAIQVSEARQWHDYIDVRASRKPQYDKFAEQGFVPKQTLLEDGWWFECCGYKENPRRRCCQHLTIEDNPVVINEEVYCQECGSKMNAG